MIRASVDLELRDLPVRKAVSREHALDGLPDDLRGPPVELLRERSRPQAARIAGVTVVALLLELVPGHGDLLGIHDDDEVPGVDVRREFGLPLAAERVGNAGRQPAQGLALGVHDVPASLDLMRFRVPGLHRRKGRTRVRLSGRRW
jgi:hypothetical protein